MTVTLHLKPEIEAGLGARAQASGMTLEDYLLSLFEEAAGAQAQKPEATPGESGMVWENGLLVYRTGTKTFLAKQLGSRTPARSPPLAQNRPSYMPRTWNPGR